MSNREQASGRDLFVVLLIVAAIGAFVLMAVANSNKQSEQMDQPMDYAIVDCAKASSYIVSGTTSMTFYPDDFKDCLWRKGYRVVAS